VAAGVEKRTRNLLILLAILLAAAVYTNSGWLFEDAEDEASSERSEISLGERLDTLKELPEIPLDRPYSAEDYSAQRNLFDFTKSPEQIAAEKAREEQRQRQAELQRKKRQEQRERQQAREERTERRQRQKAKKDRVPPPPDFQYTYVAYMSHLKGKEEALAVLVKGSGSRDPKKENIRIVRNGEILDDDFVIKQIDLDNLVIGYTDDRYDGQTRRVELIPPRDDGRGGGRRGGGRRRR
jgi:type IV secretory pathway VirB10-like protein